MDYYKVQNNNYKGPTKQIIVGSCGQQQYGKNPKKMGQIFQASYLKVTGRKQ